MNSRPTRLAREVGATNPPQPRSSLVPSCLSTAKVIRAPMHGTSGRDRRGRLANDIKLKLRRLVPREQSEADTDTNIVIRPAVDRGARAGRRGSTSQFDIASPLSIYSVSPSKRRRIFPEEFLGRSATKLTLRGSLYGASNPRQWATTSSSHSVTPRSHTI